MTLAEAPRPAPAPNGRGEDPGTEAATYDATSPSVTPPAIVSPSVPWLVAVNPGDASGPAIEIIVNERGGVESVRATIRPRTVSESVLILNELSAAKNWRFRPASRNGRPVRYRMLLPIGSF